MTPETPHTGRTALQLFWSFRSPYCYLALDRLRAIAARFDVALHLRPVRPIALRNPDFLVRQDPRRRRYIRRDIRRLAEYLDVPLVWPAPDLVDFEPHRRVALPRQPLITRITRLGAAAAMRGRGIEFADAIARVLWRGEIAGWDQGPHVAGALRAAGLDPDAVQREVADDPARFDTFIAGCEAELDTTDHWGVPTVVLDGETFFGQDRLDVLAWRLERRAISGGSHA